MDRHLRTGRKSVHEVGLADLLDMARLSGQLPARRALVAIQPADTGWGEQPTPVVSAAMDRAEQHIARLLTQWSPDDTAASAKTLCNTDTHQDRSHVDI